MVIYHSIKNCNYILIPQFKIKPAKDDSDYHYFR
jgi:hypothetical protein